MPGPPDRATRQDPTGIRQPPVRERGGSEGARPARSPVRHAAPAHTAAPGRGGPAVAVRLNRPGRPGQYRRRRASNQTTSSARAAATGASRLATAGPAELNRSIGSTSATAGRCGGGRCATGAAEGEAGAASPTRWAGGAASDAAAGSTGCSPGAGPGTATTAAPPAGSADPAPAVAESVATVDSRKPASPASTTSETLRAVEFDTAEQLGIADEEPARDHRFRPGRRRAAARARRRHPPGPVAPNRVEVGPGPSLAEPGEPGPSLAAPGLADPDVVEAGEAGLRESTVATDSATAGAGSAEPAGGAAVVAVPGPAPGEQGQVEPAAASEAAPGPAGRRCRAGFAFCGAGGAPAAAAASRQ